MDASPDLIGVAQIEERGGVGSGNIETVCEGAEKENDLHSPFLFSWRSFLESLRYQVSGKDTELRRLPTYELLHNPHLGVSNIFM